MCARTNIGEKEEEYSLPKLEHRQRLERQTRHYRECAACHRAWSSSSSNAAAAGAAAINTSRGRKRGAARCFHFNKLLEYFLIVCNFDGVFLYVCVGIWLGVRVRASQKKRARASVDVQHSTARTGSNRRRTGGKKKRREIFRIILGNTHIRETAAVIDERIFECPCVSTAAHTQPCQ